MVEQDDLSAQSKTRSYISLLLRALLAIIVTFFFLTSVRIIGKSFDLANEVNPSLVKGLFERAGNPLVGVLVGVLVTSLLQSSSATTSMLVVLVAAATDPMRLDVAIPIVMGANIGSTVTNTIVAMGHVTRRNEFRRAIACSTMHDFFNMLSVMVLLPLELSTHFLERTALFIGQHFDKVTHISAPTSPIKQAMKPFVECARYISTSTFSGYWAVAAMVGIGILLLFAMLWALTRVLKSLFLGHVETVLDKYLDRYGPVGILVGAGSTAAVQSSAVTISFFVPLSAAGILRPRQIYPVVLGANLGTTITALLAALGGDTAMGLVLAISHLLFNLCGLMLFYPIPKTRIPIWIAERFSHIITRWRPMVVIYVLTTFYMLPCALIFLFG